MTSIGNLDQNSLDFHTLQFLAHVTNSRQRKWTRHDSGGWQQWGGGSRASSRVSAKDNGIGDTKNFNGEIDSESGQCRRHALLGEMSFDKKRRS